MIRIILMLLLVAIILLLVKILAQLNTSNKLMKKASKKPFEDEVDSYGVMHGNI